MPDPGQVGKSDPLQAGFFLLRATTTEVRLVGMVFSERRVGTDLLKTS